MGLNHLNDSSPPDSVETRAVFGKALVFAGPRSSVDIYSLTLLFLYSCSQRPKDHDDPVESPGWRHCSDLGTGLPGRQASSQSERFSVAWYRWH